MSGGYCQNFLAFSLMTKCSSLTHGPPSPSTVSGARSAFRGSTCTGIPSTIVRCLGCLGFRFAHARITHGKQEVQDLFWKYAYIFWKYGCTNRKETAFHGLKGRIAARCHGSLHGLQLAALVPSCRVCDDATANYKDLARRRPIRLW